LVGHLPVPFLQASPHVDLVIALRPGRYGYTRYPRTAFAVDAPLRLDAVRCGLRLPLPPFSLTHSLYTTTPSRLLLPGFLCWVGLADPGLPHLNCRTTLHARTYPHDFVPVSFPGHSVGLHVPATFTIAIRCSLVVLPFLPVWFPSHTFVPRTTVLFGCIWFGLHLLLVTCAFLLAHIHMRHMPRFAYFVAATRNATYLTFAAGYALSHPAHLAVMAVFWRGEQFTAPAAYN